MGRINTMRVLLGGVVAGIVLNVGDYLLNGMVLMDEWKAAMDALELDPVSSSTIIMLVLLDLALGIVAVWLYAAFRPRFGPGPRTALTAGFVLWLLSSALYTVGNSLTPVWPASLMMTSTVFLLFLAPLATMAGAFFYKEDEGGGGAATDAF